MQPQFDLPPQITSEASRVEIREILYSRIELDHNKNLCAQPVPAGVSAPVCKLPPCNK